MKTEKKRFWLPAIFLMAVLFLLVIPLSAFLVSEIFGWKEKIYDVLKDLGSLIAGVIAVIGVAWMVYTQKSETDKVIQSNNEVIKTEAFEKERMKAMDSALLIRVKVREMLEHCDLSPKNFSRQATKYFDEPFSHFLRDMKTSREVLAIYFEGQTNKFIKSLNLLKDVLELYGKKDWENDYSQKSCLEEVEKSEIIKTMQFIYDNNENFGVSFSFSYKIDGSDADKGNGTPQEKLMKDLKYVDLRDEGYIDTPTGLLTAGFSNYEKETSYFQYILSYIDEVILESMIGELKVLFPPKN